MATLKFFHANTEATVTDGSSIAAACEEAGLPIACGAGICGTCIVKIRSGMENLSPPTTEEIDFLGKGIALERMACQCKIVSGTVEIEF